MLDNFLEKNKKTNNIFLNNGFSRNKGNIGIVQKVGDGIVRKVGDGIVRKVGDGIVRKVGDGILYASGLENVRQENVKQKLSDRTRDFINNVISTPKLFRKLRHILLFSNFLIEKKQNVRDDQINRNNENPHRPEDNPESPISYLLILFLYLYPTLVLYLVVWLREREITYLKSINAEILLLKPLWILHNWLTSLTEFQIYYLCILGIIASVFFALYHITKLEFFWIDKFIVGMGDTFIIVPIVIYLFMITIIAPTEMKQTAVLFGSLLLLGAILHLFTIYQLNFRISRLFDFEDHLFWRIGIGFLFLATTLNHFWYLLVKNQVNNLMVLHFITQNLSHDLLKYSWLLQLKAAVQVGIILLIGLILVYSRYTRIFPFDFTGYPARHPYKYFFLQLFLTLLETTVSIMWILGVILVCWGGDLSLLFIEDLFDNAQEHYEQLIKYQFLMENHPFCILKTRQWWLLLLYSSVFLILNWINPINFLNIILKKTPTKLIYFFWYFFNISIVYTFVLPALIKFFIYISFVNNIDLITAYCQIHVAVVAENINDLNDLLSTISPDEPFNLLFDLRVNVAKTQLFIELKALCNQILYSYTGVVTWCKLILLLKKK
jgi:hypothetical protein